MIIMTTLNRVHTTWPSPAGLQQTGASALPRLWAIRHQIMGPSQCFLPWHCWCHRDLSGCRFASRAPCTIQGVHNTIDEWLAAPHARFWSASDSAAVSCDWRVVVPTSRLETTRGFQVQSLRARLDQKASRGVLNSRLPVVAAMSDKRRPHASGAAQCSCTARRQKPTC
jgi:hypothetical protein